MNQTLKNKSSGLDNSMAMNTEDNRISKPIALHDSIKNFTFREQQFQERLKFTKEVN